MCKLRHLLFLKQLKNFNSLFCVNPIVFSYSNFFTITTYAHKLICPGGIFTKKVKKLSSFFFDYPAFKFNLIFEKRLDCDLYKSSQTRGITIDGNFNSLFLLLTCVMTNWYK